MSHRVELIQKYFDALSKGDFETVGSLFSNNLVWHQPGKGVLSGTIKGKENVFAHLGNFPKLSNGTFMIDKVDYITGNNNLVAASIHFKASSEKGSMQMKGVDLFRIEDNLIQEVWLFSENIDAEDEFWKASHANLA